MSDLIDLSGRTAVITGAGKGIGAATAEVLAAHGAHLILNDIDTTTGIHEKAKRLSQLYSVETYVLIGDVANQTTSAEIAKLAFSHYRGLSIWVNNAGILVDGRLGMITSAEIERSIAVNLSGVMHGTQQASRLMLRGGGGSIINITSITGRFGNSGQLLYGGTKAGVIGATLSASKELAYANIRVNAVAPGLIDTDMTRQLRPDKFKERFDSIGMKRIGAPNDVAQCILFLASDMSSYITGQVIGVDGGMII